MSGIADAAQRLRQNGSVMVDDQVSIGCDCIVLELINALPRNANGKVLKTELRAKTAPSA